MPPVVRPRSGASARRAIMGPIRESRVTAATPAASTHMMGRTPIVVANVPATRADPRDYPSLRAGVVVEDVLGRADRAQADDRNRLQLDGRP